MRYVSVPYEITLLSNGMLDIVCHNRVSVPYEITLLSNYFTQQWDAVEFQYLMKLHYSQTAIAILLVVLLFQYLMKLHYSQTTLDVALA